MAGYTKRMRRFARRTEPEGVHRDERGGMADYAMVLGVAIPIAVFVVLKLFDVLADYFGMIAFFASWPFI